MSHRTCGLGWKPGKGSNPAKYPMKAVLRRAPAPPLTGRKLWWTGGLWIDQGGSSTCTICAWLHLIADGPLTQPALIRSFGRDNAGVMQSVDRLYREGQVIDGWPPAQLDRVTDSGLTTDAAAQVMKRHGWIGAYHWAQSANDVIDALLRVGPVTIGLDWREPMFDPDPRTGRLRYEGPEAGGHQVLLDGVDCSRRTVRLKNSWGRSYGRNGFAFLGFDDLDRIIANGGEACVATELRGTVPAPVSPVAGA